MADTPQQPSNEPQNPIPESRRVMYYAGMLIAGTGALLFISVFFSAACAMSSHRMDLDSSMPIRAVSGFFMMFFGGIIMTIGRVGMAAAGFKLDPNRMREDLRPWNRLGGQMLNDQLSEVEPIQKIADGLSRIGQQATTVREVIKIRCRSCGGLDEETARFCSHCGKEM